MLLLPISGLRVVVRPPTGAEDLLLQEAGELDTGLALRLLDRLARPADKAAGDWKGLTITDFEALLLMLRRATLGDVIRAEANCAGCGTKADVSFRISEFLGSQKSRRPRGVEKIDGDDAYRFSGEGVQFRLPNCSDLIETDRQMNWEIELIRRCARPADVPVRMRQRIERAMEFLTPRFSRILAGECPECHASMNSYFDVQQFVLRELRDHAAMVFEDIHLLAMYYNWPEQDILALPRSRRAYYADAIRSQRGAA
jgi:hypothetical protein